MLTVLEGHCWECWGYDKLGQFRKLSEALMKWADKGTFWNRGNFSTREVGKMGLLCGTHRARAFLGAFLILGPDSMHENVPSVAVIKLQFFRIRNGRCLSLPPNLDKMIKSPS